MALKRVDLDVSRGDAVLSLLERARVPPLPALYKLFYDYVAGVQTLSTGRIGDLLADGRPKDANFGEHLYEEFVRPYAETDAIDAAVEKMVQRLKTLDTTIVATGKASRAQSASLRRASTDLDADEPDVGLLREWVGRLAIANDAMLEANANLLRELDNSNDALASAKAELAQVSRDSLIDPLTGIANRAGLDVALSDALTAAASEGGARFALALLDIDKFKTLNDSYGHQTGDNVLRLVARALLATVRSGDTVGRIGGDEFIAVLHDVDVDGARAAAENIRNAVHDSDLAKVLGDRVLGGATASIGIALYRPGDSIVSMFARADGCLLDAKRLGRNRVVGEVDAELEQLAQSALG